MECRQESELDPEPDAMAHPACHTVHGQPQEQVMSGEINWYYFRKG